MALDLDLTEVTLYMQDAIDTLGKTCTIDGVSTKMMLNDINESSGVTSVIQDNQKQAVVINNIAVNRGSLVVFEDDTSALVYTIPNDDLVSYSMKILMCNASIEKYSYEPVYDNDTGDIVSVNNSTTPLVFNGFIMKASSGSNQYDIGLLHDTVLKFITVKNTGLNVNDTIVFNGDNYKIIDLDEVTSGLTTLQLASVVS